MKHLLIIWTALGLCGCATAGRVNDGLIGLDMQDVLIRLGHPQNSVVRDQYTYWGYRYRSWDEYALAPFVLGLNLLVSEPHEIRIIQFNGSRVRAWGNPEFFGWNSAQPVYYVAPPEAPTQPQRPQKFNCSLHTTYSGRVETDCQTGGRYESAVGQ